MRLPLIQAAFLVQVLFIPLAGAEIVPFDDGRWQIQGQESELLEHKGRQALYLKGASAVLEGAELEDGIIEFDILFNDERGFSGVFWRRFDGLNGEQFYVRPHQSGNPDANQYQPIFNGNANWQLYHGPSYSRPVTYRPGEWTHIKVVFSGKRAEFYIDSETPLFVTDQQKHEVASGGLGVFASGFAAAWFANFDYRELPPGYTIADPGMAPAPLPDRVTSWEISTVFDGATLADVSRLDAAHTDALQWQRLDAEDTGITNISRLRILAEGANTVFARLRIDSDRPQPLDLHFGFSDTAQVFLNGRKLYAGNRLYESQDYRYLGTIGLFDSLSLDLRSGSNEVLIAVGERFGGWGLMAAIDPPPGVSVRD